jgi:hypothetical protein
MRMKKNNNKLNDNHKFPKIKMKMGFGEVIYRRCKIL